MAYQPIEHYGIIGNMRTAALVGMNGSIDWFCVPFFDSPSVFAAILDDQKGGRFEIAPLGEDIRAKQFYWPETNVLVTRFLSPDGVGEVIDFMPVGLPRESPWQDQLIRRVKVTRGTMAFRMTCRPAFDDARVSHRTVIEEHGAVLESAVMNSGLARAVRRSCDAETGDEPVALEAGGEP